MPAETDTPWIPMVFSASSAFRANLVADSRDVPNRLRISSTALPSAF